MNIETVDTRDELAAAYLQQLQSLASEISGAMEAISSNSLTALRESVARQEMLCAEVATAARAFGHRSPAPEQPLSPAETQVEAKIRAAGGAILELNLQYGALLKHSGRTIALLLSLCRSHTGQSQEARGPRLKQKTWSCEM
jgi:hypothetical protein